MVTQVLMNSKKAEKISKALADPNRLQILKEIRKQKDECLYCSNINETINLAQPSIAHHLKLLVDTEIILSEKEGRNVKYRLNNRVIDEYITFLETLKR